MCVTLKARIREARKGRICMTLVVGLRDQTANADSVRIHGKGDPGSKPRAEVIAGILAATKERQV